jgi:hypothetical protein
MTNAKPLSKTFHLFVISLCLFALLTIVDKRQIIFFTICLSLASLWSSARRNGRSH